MRQSLKLLGESDALICSSRDETMPIAILEAMSLGKLVISTDVGGISEWLRDEMNGLLVHSGRSVGPGACDRAFAARWAPDETLCAWRRDEPSRGISRWRVSRRISRACSPRSRPRGEKSRREHCDGYAEWLRQTQTFDDRIALRRKLGDICDGNRGISVVLPVYNPEPASCSPARSTSIKSQVYEQWELCLADDASTDPEVRPFLEEQALATDAADQTDISRDGTVTSPACSNSALPLATGEWCALLDQDDVVAPDALACVALEIDRHPDAGLIYSDEDKIDVAGARSEPFFKTRLES